MTKKAKEKVLTKWDAISIALETARYCGISQQDIQVFNVVMDVRIDKFLHGPIEEIPPQENQAT